MKVILLSLAFLTPALPALAGDSFIDYLRHSAARGEAESQFVLGLAHRDGWDGIIRLGSTTAKWCELAAELDDQRPSLVIGLLQKHGGRVPKDETKAIELLGQAAARGDDYARVILGDMLLEGDGVAADWRSGADLIAKSAGNGFAPAQFRLGLIYLVGEESTPQDDVESLAWFILAAESGSKPAEVFRDERTRLLGQEIARLASKRSRNLLVKDEPSKRSQAELAGS